MKKILMVVTSFEKYPQTARACGLWLGEAVHFVSRVEAARYEVDIVSPRGGYTPIDPLSLALADELDWEWYQNKSFMNRLGSTLKPAAVNPQDYAAIYYAGGHGAVWDFPDNTALQAIGRQIYQQGGVVSAVCHGVAGLLNIRLDDGSLLVEGKQMSCFSNTEERLSGLAGQLPFLPESELVKRGASYHKAVEPWEPCALVDQRVLSGQNPASTARLAELLLEALRTHSWP
ncbi:type 1 glutamine amidotransferase domain-containing protein [Aquitalea aquatica]|uniref:Type 1 glutamine amidotransferase domain-containing protein n=1 Tax=Aquitalea aquatica TaxID=3044273 RepID=A0A838Y7L1_9NEIS|nr:type 1 glutamine amidotransferase domain-containing protein [Aquitalea magnusonii]MBA4708569.1 type 1 glutamine amidotransferase domain-containing protein [Aquitalea magnusonii]